MLVSLKVFEVFCFKFLKTIENQKLQIYRITYHLDTLKKQPPEVFCKKGGLRNFAKFTGKNLCQSLFFNKVAGLRLWHRCFPVNFAKFPRTPFLQKTSERLLLTLKYKLASSRKC